MEWPIDETEVPEAAKGNPSARTPQWLLCVAFVVIGVPVLIEFGLWLRFR